MTDHQGESQSAPQATAADVSWALHNLVVAAAIMDVGLGQRLSLSPADYQAMKHLMTSTRPLGTVELGSLVGLTSGSATGLVDRLEHAGHLQRHRDPNDRRRLILQPTAEAIRRTTNELQPLDEHLQALLATYSDPELVAILRFLREAANVYRSFGEHGMPEEAGAGGDPSSGAPKETDHR